jgi:pyruvate formate lyase activating enzyme
VDLKGFSEDFYRHLTLSHLEPVLDTLKWLRRATNVWLEITNLVIPGHNDDPRQIEAMCQWIVRELGEDTPVHFTAFHPDYRMLNVPPTPAETVMMARRLAQGAGLRYVYTGNVFDPAGQATYCPDCGRRLISRHTYDVSDY